MGEILRNKRVATLLAVVVGGLALAGCNGETHGLAGMNLVDCENGPKNNEITLENFTKDQSFEMGKDIKTGNAGTTAFGNKYSISAPFTIESLGNGAFTYYTGHDDSKQDAVVPPTPHPDGTFTLSLVDQEQTYKLTGSPNADGSTKLVIEASCAQ